MPSQFSRIRKPARILVILLAAVIGLMAPQPALALDHNSPEVKTVVKKAIGYLATAKDPLDRLGAVCLIGLCFKKHGIDNHPKIKEAVDKCYAANVKSEAVDNYSLGIALMFLCEADPEKHHELIQKFVDELLARQKPHGGFGYPHRPTGDTSQTQYSVLGMWMAKNFAQIDIPIDRQEAVCGWLMRTQDPSGGWGYQGIDSGSGRVKQEGVTLTLTASASGSIYIMADMLQITQRKDSGTIGRPKAIQASDVASKAGEAGGPLARTLDPDAIKMTLAGADRYMTANFAMPTGGQWNHYYMYALERYQSFREASTGVKDDKWYKAGFDYLSRTQTPSGNWEGSDNTVVATCLATLFLLRSSLKAIDKRIQMVEGTARGNRGLPADVSNIQDDGKGKVVNESVTVPTEEILRLLESNDTKVDELAEQREALKLSEKGSERISQLEKLRNFVSSGKFETRMVAVTTLGKVRDLDNVPRLLFALSDPDPQIVRQADRGLRFISRKVDGVGLPEIEPSAAQIKATQTAWRNWYLSIRPNAELLD